MDKILNEKTKKLLITFGAVIGVIVVIIILVAVINSFKTVKLDYSAIEDKMTSAARKYYSNRTDALPLNDEDIVEVSSVTLSEEKYMKDLSKYIKQKNVSCTGKVVVTKSGDYYNYSPYLDCGDTYTTTYLYEKLLETVVSKDDGLYKTTQYSPEKKAKDTFYVYKGDYVNNYVKVDEIVWRIIKLDSDYNYTLIESKFDRENGYSGAWDNRYNELKKGNYGINDYYKSLIRRAINIDYYNILSDNVKSKFILKPVCVGPISETQKTIDGSIECKTTIDTDYLSLLTSYDYLNASLDKSCKSLDSKTCKNYNYLVNYTRSFWLVNTNAINTYTGYKIDSGIYTGNLSSSGSARIVVNMGKNLIYTGGSGTESDPYLVK